MALSFTFVSTPRNQPVAIAGVSLAADGSAAAVVSSNTALSVPETEIRLFGKPESFKKRRMGVAASRGKDTDEARARAKQAASAVKPVKS